MTPRQPPYTAHTLMELAQQYRAAGRSLAAESVRRTAQDLAEPPGTRRRWQHGTLQQIRNWQVYPTVLHCRICYQETKVQQWLDETQIRNHPGLSPCATVRMKRTTPTEQLKRGNWRWRRFSRTEEPEFHAIARSEEEAKRNISRCGFDARWEDFRQRKDRFLDQPEILASEGYPLLQVNCPDCLATLDLPERPFQHRHRNVLA